MRRLALAVVIGTLALSACSDQPQEALTGPSLPQAAKKCLIDPFPFSTIVAQILNVYPDGLRGDAVSRTTTIKNNWDGCRPVPAQQGAVDFVSRLNQDFQNNTLSGTDAQRTLLIKTLLESVGFPAPPSFPLGPDFGVGFYDPTKTTPTLITTASNTALTELGFGAFSEPTLIVIGRRPDQPPPLNFDVDHQFPPFFDYNAINASGNHFLENGPTAIVAFCFLAGVEYPDYEEARIGHNPPSAEPTFEVLEPVDIRTGGERPDLGEALDCENFQPTPGSIDFGYLGLGMPGLASAGWKAASHYLRPVARALFLPAALNAATLGSLGPIAGKAGSFSPFGVVEEEAGPVIPSLSCEQEGTIRSTHSNVPVTMTFVNQTTQSVSVYWLNFGGVRQFQNDPSGLNIPYRVLAPGTSYAQPTFLTHPWILIGADGTCYGIFLPSSEGGRVTVPSGQIN